MSYTIAIVVPPVPGDDRTAWAVLDGLIAETGPRPVDDGVWSDGPLIDNFGHRAAVLGVVFSRVDEVLPVVVRAANELGLVVFDWQTNRVHRG